MVWSQLAEANCAAVGREGHGVHCTRMPGKRFQHISRKDIPQSDALVRTAGGELPAIGRKCD